MPIPMHPTANPQHPAPNPQPPAPRPPSLAPFSEAQLATMFAIFVAAPSNAVVARITGVPVEVVARLRAEHHWDDVARDVRNAAADLTEVDHQTFVECQMRLLTSLRTRMMEHLHTKPSAAGAIAILKIMDKERQAFDEIQKCKNDKKNAPPPTAAADPRLEAGRGGAPDLCKSDKKSVPQPAVTERVLAAAGS